ncbi:MAG TPA: hypothetical protein VER14_00940 [Phototrophicaceae bacterium]|nr:hypothetical protein [Phototrophicaceae bacterium]
MITSITVPFTFFDFLLETYGNFVWLEISNLDFANKRFYTPIIEEGQSQKIYLATISLLIEIEKFSHNQNKSSIFKSVSKRVIYETK